MIEQRQQLVASELDDNEAIEYVASVLTKVKSKGTLVVVLLSGAGGGSTTLARKLTELLPKSDFIGTDDFLVGDRRYRRENLEGKNPLLKYDIEYMDKVVEQIRNLKENQEILVPCYDEFTGLAMSAKKYNHKIKALEYLIVEGDFQFIKNPDFIIYMDVSDEVRLQNRLGREVSQRNEKSKKSIRENFELRQKLQHIPYLLPMKEKSDMVLAVDAKKLQGRFSYAYSIYLKKKKAII